MDDDHLVAMLPCKPDRATRQLPLLGPQQRAVDVNMAGCEAAGSTWAVAYAKLPDASLAAGAMDHWRRATLAQVRGSAGAQHRITIKTVAGQPPVDAVLTIVRGLSPTGEAVAVQAVYFVRDERVYQAVVLGTRTDDQALETFVSGLVAR